MKISILLVLLINYATGSSFNFADGVESGQNYTELFRQYSKKLDQVLVYSVVDYSQKDKLLIVIGTKGKNLYYIKHYNSTLRTKDSVEYFVCQQNASTYFNQLKSAVLTIPDESVIKAPCIQKKDTMINGAVVTQIQDLKNNADLQIDIVESKIDGKNKRIAYQGLDIAYSICPESKERKEYANLIKSIKNGLKERKWKTVYFIQ